MPQEPPHMLVVQYPRGAAAIVWLDPTTGAITTNHAGLQAMLRAGVRNWEGYVVHPHEGPKFLSAVYDYLFLSGYPVYWKRMGAMRGVQNTYRV